jgi:TonB family protein
LRLDSPAGNNSLPPLYTQRALLRIQQAFVVPPELSVPGLKSTISWQILPDGTITDIRLDRSSDRPDLDELAMAALRRAENLGRLPTGFPAAGIRVSLEFEFSGGE